MMPQQLWSTIYKTAAHIRAVASLSNPAMPILTSSEELQEQAESMSEGLNGYDFYR